MPAPPASPEPPLLRTRPDWVICDQCDAVHQRQALASGQVAQCQRCGALLGRGHLVSLQGLLAFAVAALICLIIGNLAPLVSLEMRGAQQSVSLPLALQLTAQAGHPGIALLAGACAVGFPLAMIGLRLYVLWPLSRGILPRHFIIAMHALRHATLWSMVEVFVLSALVAIVRSAGFATVVPGPALAAYGALTLLLTSLTAAGLHTLWHLGTHLQDTYTVPQAKPPVIEAQP